MKPVMSGRLVVAQEFEAKDRRVRFPLGDTGNFVEVEYVPDSGGKELSIRKSGQGECQAITIRMDVSNQFELR